MIILKNLKSAIADGDNILATLKGSAIAQDGKTNGIMAPNAKAQELVGRLALERAGVDPLTVGYVEGHITATPLGDPTEASALTRLYGSGCGRPLDAPVPIGSLKPNVGHLEAAAGAIGFVKAVLAVNKGQLAPQALLTKLTSKVDWPHSGLLPPVLEATEWTNPDGPRRAAVCNYGYGGTVSHAIIEEFKTTIYEAPVRLLSSGPVILTLSGAAGEEASEQAMALASRLSTNDGLQSDLGAVANTLAQRRAHYDYRVAFVVESHHEAVEALKKYAAGSKDSLASAVQGRSLGSGGSGDPARQAVWVFSGHGAQWQGMGKELLTNPVFCGAIASLEAIVRQEAGFSITEALTASNFVEASEKVQILTYAIQVRLIQVFASKAWSPRL